MVFASILLVVFAQNAAEKDAMPETVSGIVTDSEGHPVEGAEVLLGETSLSPVRRTVVARGRSDAHGRFALTVAPSSVSDVSDGSRARSLLAHKPGSCWTGRPLRTSQAPAPREPTRLVLRPAATVAYRVLDPSGQPVVGARVSARFLGTSVAIPEEVGERLQSRTDVEGNASISPVHPDEIGGVEVVAPAWGTMRFGRDAGAAGRHTLRLRSVSRLVGRLVADDPREVAGVTLSGSTRVYDAPLGTPTGVFEVTSDAAGRFHVPALASGRLWIRAQPRAGSRYRTPILTSETIEAGKPKDIEVRLVRGVKVRGVVQEQGTDKPLAGLRLTLQTVPDRNAPSVTGELGFYASARTDAVGRYEVVLLPGEFQASISQGSAYKLPAGLAMPSATIGAQARDIEFPPIVLVPAGQLRGVVRGDDGKGVAGADVEVSWPANRGLSGTLPEVVLGETNSLGEFLFERVPPDVELRLLADAGESCSGPPQLVRAGGLPVTIRVSRENTRSLGGRVVDERGAPIAGAVVQVYSRARVPGGGFTREGTRPGRMKWNLRTDAEGRFQTPRQLRRSDEHCASASAPGKKRGETMWFTPATSSLFDLTLYELPGPEDGPIQEASDAGWAAYYRGDYDEAVKQFQRAVDEEERHAATNPTHRLHLAGRLSGLAEAKLMQSQPAAAETIARRLLTLREQLLGDANSGYAEALWQVARTCEAQMKFDEAERLFRRAVDLAANENKESPDYSWRLLALAVHLSNRGQHESAEPLFHSVLELNGRTIIPEEPNLFHGILGAAVNKSALGNVAEAETLYKKALATADDVLEENLPPVFIEILDHYASLLREDGRNGDAESLEARAKALRAKKQPGA